MAEENSPAATTSDTNPLTPEAARALAEAEARRKAALAAGEKAVTEVGGRNGLDPIRYGDWEKGGIASDF